MPKTKNEIVKENRVKALIIALVRQRASEKRLGKYVGDRLGISENTGRKLVYNPERLTVANLADLKLTDEEVLKIVRGV